MPVSHHYFFTRCPHCRTIFRVSSAVSEQSGDWAKCGHCKKVLELKKNQIDPKDFLQADESVVQDKVTPKPDTSEVKSTATPDIPTDPTHSDKTPPQQAAASIKSSPASVQSTDKDPKQQSPSGLATEPMPVEKLKPAEEQLSFIKNKQSDSGFKASQQTLPESAADNSDNKAHQVEPILQAKHDRTIESTRLSKQGVKQEKISPRVRQKSVKARDSVRARFDSRTSPQFSSTPAGIGTDSTASNKTDNKKTAKGPQITNSIVARAQRFKKDKNRSNPTFSYSAWGIVLGLVALLIWQIAIVNYTKLKNYSFLAVPLNFTCAIFSCNQQAPLSQSEFEILHASLRRHTSVPGVITISANLINYSNNDKLLPSIRLDLTGSDESIVASKTINLVDNPQFLDPAISQLAPGQDVKIVFDVDRPPRAAVGFALNIVD